MSREEVEPEPQPELQCRGNQGHIPTPGIQPTGRAGIVGLELRAIYDAWVNEDIADDGELRDAVRTALVLFQDAVDGCDEEAGHATRITAFEANAVLDWLLGASRENAKLPPRLRSPRFFEVATQILIQQVVGGTR